MDTSDTSKPECSYNKIKCNEQNVKDNLTNETTSVKSKVSLAEIKRRARALKISDIDVSDEIFDPYKKTMDNIRHIRGLTAIIDNEIVSKEHRCEWDKNYPEKPERLESVMQRVYYHGLHERCLKLAMEFATKEQILSIHSTFILKLLGSTAEKNISLRNYERLSSRYDSVFINKHTYESALTASGCCIKLVKSILSGKVQNGMAFVRPPGHHAMHNEFNGYCFFNNASIAAKFALTEYKLDRILIVDLDVHHGQGIQQHFFKTNKVLYFSVHRYEDAIFWPSLYQSDYDYVGEGNGEGYNFNVPLNEVGMTDIDYLTIFYKLLMPVAYEYNPQLVIFSAGYDAAVGCPEGEMKITPACYGIMTHLLQMFANGRVAVMLEGGYNLTSLSEGAAMTLRALLDDPVPPLQPLKTVKPSVLESIYNCIKYHKRYWKCFWHLNGMVTPDPIKPIPFPEYTSSKNYETRNCYPVCIEDENLKTELYNCLIKKTPEPSIKVLIIYDEEMLKHNTRDGTRPLECPDRLKQVFQVLKTSGILDRCHLLKGEKMQEDQLTSIHSSDYLKTLQNVISKNDTTIFSSLYTNEFSYECALFAAGSSLKLLHEFMNTNCSAQTGFALVRPPGHHAEPDRAGGFCFFNNVAFVAQCAIDKYKLKRVLIVDFDVHHPNGTYEIFKAEKRCLLISIHRYGNNFYPNTGKIDEVGIGDGEGYNVNIPWSGTKYGDAEYLLAFLRVVMPIATQYNPELVLVSAGFDAAFGDPLGHLYVTPQMFGHMTAMLKSLACGRVLMFLEGGYNIASVSHSVLNCVKALLGDPLIPLTKAHTPSTEASHILDEVCNIQSKYWSGLILPMPKTVPVHIPGFEVIHVPQNDLTRNEVCSWSSWIVPETDPLHISDLESSNVTENELPLIPTEEEEEEKVNLEPKNID